MKASKLIMYSEHLPSETDIEKTLAETSGRISILKDMPAIINVSEEDGNYNVENIYEKRFKLFGDFVPKKKRVYQSRIRLDIFYNQPRSIDCLMNDITSISGVSEIEYGYRKVIELSDDCKFMKDFDFKMSTGNNHSQREYYSTFEFKGIADEEETEILHQVSDKVFKTRVDNIDDDFQFIIDDMEGETHISGWPKTILYKKWKGEIDVSNIRNFMRDAILKENKLWISGRYYEGIKTDFMDNKRSDTHWQVNINKNEINNFRFSHCYEAPYRPRLNIVYKNGKNCVKLFRYISQNAILSNLIGA